LTVCHKTRTKKKSWVIGLRQTQGSHASFSLERTVDTATMWSVIHSSLLQPLGQGLAAISSKEAKPEELWYLSPEQHVAELIFFNTLFIGGLFGRSFVLRKYSVLIF
jgi:hypothetical protein